MDPLLRTQWPADFNGIYLFLISYYNYLDKIKGQLNKRTSFMYMNIVTIK